MNEAEYLGFFIGRLVRNCVLAVIGITIAVVGFVLWVLWKVIAFPFRLVFRR